MAFQDHFSAGAADYARFRPVYPPRLFEFLAGLAPARRLAWDAGTGNGQAAIGLAVHFGEVQATDPSQKQLDAGRPHPRITYRKGDEGDSGLPGGACDLVTAAQAAHWFDMHRFAGETKRVLGRGGVVAIWGYGLCAVGPGIDALVQQFYSETTGPYWPPGRHHVDAAYRTLTFPFSETTLPEMSIEARLDLTHFSAYLRTWSAVQRLEQATGSDPVQELLMELAPRWGEPSLERTVHWPLFGRVGSVPG